MRSRRSLVDGRQLDKESRKLSIMALKVTSVATNTVLDVGSSSYGIELSSNCPFRRHPATAISHPFTGGK
jgi:hypothetical protein